MRFKRLRPHTKFRTLEYSSNSPLRFRDSEFSLTMSTEITIFWNVTPCSLEGSCKHIGGTSPASRVLHLYDKTAGSTNHYGVTSKRLKYPSS
jgi:hypothetical protein